MSRSPEAPLHQQELGFDHAVKFGRLNLAQAIILELNDMVNSRIQSGESVSRAPQLLMKEVALPMNRRAEADIKGTQYANAEVDISAMYAQSVDLLIYFRDWHDATILSRKMGNRDNLRGSRSEVLFFTLLARTSRGSSDDVYNFWPASQKADHGANYRDNGGRATGIDFIVQLRSTLEFVRTQVKTSHSSRNYVEGILVILTQEIAGGTPEAQDLLEQAVIDEVAGHATPEQVAHIEESLARLEEKMRPYLSQDASQITA
jgi:hypothetical protein